MATPGKTEQENQRYQSEEFFELSGIGHVGVFKVETSLLEVTEELLNSPTQFVKSESFFTVEAVAHEVKPVIPTPLTNDVGLNAGKAANSLLIKPLQPDPREPLQGRESLQNL